MKFNCHHCGKETDKPSGHVNRARELGLNLYCSKKCAGLARRKYKTKAQRKEEKRLYDIEYRKTNLEAIKAKKKAHYKATFDRVKEAEYRKKRMPKHVEYCRRPEYKKWKSEYDRNYRARKYGEFAEAYLMLQELDKVVNERMTNYEVRIENGTINKALKRRRQDQ